MISHFDNAFGPNTFEQHSHENGHLEDTYAFNVLDGSYPFK